MRRRLLLVTAMLGLCGVALAEGFSARLEKANGLVRDGQPGKALEIYQALQPDYPRSAMLLYNMGCAYYSDGMAKANAQSYDDAVAGLRQAHATFERAVAAADGPLREKAAFNGANALAEIARQLHEAKKYDEAKQGYEAAIRAYQAVLKEYPDNTGARHNLDCMQYQLKLLLQNPPQKPDQQKQDDKKDDQKNQERRQIEVQAETDLPGATVQTSQDTSSATVRLVVPQGQTP